MSTWTADELDRIGDAEELEVASRRRDGALSSRRTIWVVRVGDEIYIRSVNGAGSDWYRGTRVHQEGRIEAGGVTRDVGFEDADEEMGGTIDAAYRSKYSHYAASIIDRITNARAGSTTMRLVPRSNTS